MTPWRPWSRPRAARPWPCESGRTPSRSADTAHGADTGPARSYGEEAKGWRLNRSAGSFVSCHRNARFRHHRGGGHMTLGWDNPTADPTTTVLLRHGDTQLSPEHRFSGLRDLPLSASGTRQAKAAACRLATGAPIDAVVSSPLQRAA